jgi:hypothetical protein
VCCAEPASWRWFSAPILHARTVFHLIDALAEGDAGVRRDAVLAMEQMAGHEAVWLLRLKARLGDKPEVTGQVFESLLRLKGKSSVSFVAGFLDLVNSEEVAEGAALALGASRIPQALDTLKEAWKKSRNTTIGPVLLRAISISRLDDAFEFLLAIVREARQAESADALRALEIHRDSEYIRRRTEEALARMARKS